MDKAQLSKRFKNFAAEECSGSSELYAYFSLKISEDDELLELCSNARDGQPVPNLFLGAIHYLLLKGHDHVLKEYYSSVGKQTRVKDDSFMHLKDFCRLYRADIISILENKLVQTNEVRRCAYLYPSFCFIYTRVKKPLSLVEIGTSAGLQLLWDKYCYSYGNDEIYGNQQSDVHLTAEVEGGNFPTLLETSPPVASRVGLDLHISDLTNREDYLWLKSLIWPEHQERLRLFENAANHFNENPVRLIKGNGVALLNEVIEQLPKDTPVCIFHTHVANQMPEDTKCDLMEKIKVIGRNRDVFHLYNNMWDRKLHLDYFLNGIEYNSTIGETDGHGRWFNWSLQ